MIEEYSRWNGVPNQHYVLMRVDCFGEMGGPYYSSSILYHSKSRQELEDFCKEKGYELNSKDGWDEYFITNKKR